jgi:hypothetical protein
MDIEIKSEASVLTVQPGDVIVVKIEGGDRLSRDQHETIGMAVRGAIDALELKFKPPVLIVDSKTEISLIRTLADFQEANS